MATQKPQPTTAEKLAKEYKILKEYLDDKDATKGDLLMRVSGLTAQRGSSGYQLAGYNTLEQFYRGDQWTKDPQPGASQKTDNYCAVTVDNLSSLIFDDSPEINCPTDDPTNEIEELKAEFRERLIWKVWNDNDYQVEFDETSKQGSLYGDAFIKGPWVDKVNELGDIISPNEKGKWRIRFQHIENPGSIRLIFADSANRILSAFIQDDRIPLSRAVRLYGKLAEKRGIKIEKSENPNPWVSLMSLSSQTPMVNISERWDNKKMAIFINDKLLDYYEHNWGFVPLQYIKNNYIPNHPFGKSDLEDILDPQLAHNETNNDLANLLKWISSMNMWGKNLEGMSAMVAGISRLYSLPEDGELHAFEKTGDPYIANTFVQQRRSTIMELSGMSESMLSSSQVSNASGRALALAFQGTIRKLNPRAKRYSVALKNMNSNILKLFEKYFPETKPIIDGNYVNEVHLPTTILRNIVDTINKFQSGLISQDTAMREAGVAQPNLEKKIMRKDLQDPVLAPQVARQPQLLPQLNEGQNQPGDNPMSNVPGNSPSASQGGAVAANNQHGSGGAPVPTQ